MVETGEISKSIQQVILPALNKLNFELEHLDRSQQELRKVLERINAEAQVLEGIMENPKPIQNLDLLNQLRKRIYRIHRKLELITSRLNHLTGL